MPVQGEIISNKKYCEMLRAGAKFCNLKTIKNIEKYIKNNNLE